MASAFETAVKKIRRAAYDSHASGKTQPTSIEFTIAEIRALEAKFYELSELEW